MFCEPECTVNDQDVKSELDTGVAVTCLGEEVFKIIMCVRADTAEGQHFIRL